MTGSRLPQITACIEGDACLDIWKVVNRELLKHQRDGGLVRPSVRRALDELRAKGQDHLTLQAMFAREHVSRPVTNIAPESVVTELLSTQGLADRLDCTPTHARRLASEAGIEPAARNAWRPTDVDALVVQRRGQR